MTTQPRVRLFTALACALCLSVAALADEPAGRILSADILLGSERQFVIRTAYEVTAPPREWYGLYCLVRLDKDTTLKTADGKDFLRKWNDLYMPDNAGPARWSDSRLAITLDDLQTATNLPKGKRTMLWAVMDLYRPSTGKWISNGMPQAAPFFVTTDDSGKIVRVDQFVTDATEPKKSNPAKKAPTRESELTSTHLKLKPGAVLHEVKRFGFGDDGKYHVLAMGDIQASVFDNTRGLFFEPIDSPEKAADLVMLGFPDGLLIKTAAQYKAIVDALKQIGDWNAAEFLAVETPAAYGVPVAEEPGLGYRVSVLAFDYDSNYRDLGPRTLTLHQFSVSRDGRMGRKQTPCLFPPQRPVQLQGEGVAFSRPEFGRNGVPLDKAPSDAAVKAYNAAIDKALTAEGSEKLAPRYKTTDRKSEIPFPVGEDFVYGT